MGIAMEIWMYNPIRKSRLTENIKKYYNQKNE